MAKKGSAPRQHAPATTDARFARLHTDPRFLRPQRDDAKVAVDDRFKSLLGGGAGAAGAGGDFGIHKRNAKVDRFGRKTKKGRSKEDEEIQRLYKVEGEDDDEDDEDSEEEEEDSEEEDESAAGPIDYARGAVELESSGEEESSDEDDEEESDSDSSSASGDVAIGSAAVLRRERKRRAQRDESDSDSEEEDDDGEEASDVDEAAEKEIDPRALAALDAQAERAVAEASSSEAGPSTSKAAASSSSKRSKRKQQATIAPGSETRRLAIVNMDWDHVRALDIYKVFSSLVSPHATRLPGTENAAVTGSNGRPGPSSQQVKGLVESVRVYPSDFGRERMKREDVEGPPREIFKTAEDDAATARRKAKNKKKSKKRREADSDDDDSDDAIFEVDEGAEFDDAALRAYQLDRLRYYYAIATFDSPLSARHVYDIVDGAEMERTANIFDLQFVPDEMDFPDSQEDKDKGVEGWRDEAKPGVDDAVGYRGADWATDALRHSKVKLTWDAPDPERMKVTRMRNMTKGEIRDDDFRAYLASDSEGGEEDDDDEEGAEAAQGKAAGAGRDRFRALLGLDDNAGSSKNGVFGRSRSSAFEDAREDGEEEDGDMEITFLPGLSEAAARKAAGGSAKDAADKEETTLEKYMRKQREKKERRRAARGERVDEEEEEALRPAAKEVAAATESGKDLGFDDPFFASGGEEEEDFDAILAKEQAEEAKQKGKKSKKSTPSAQAAPDPLAADGDESEDDGRHFSMQDVLKAEQAKAGKKPNRWERKKLAKLAKRAAADGDSNDATAAALAQQKKKLEAQPDFKLDTADPRFFSANTLDDHRFAVDPTHPSYMKTEGMQRALEERRKRGGRKEPVEEEPQPVKASKQDGKKRKQDKMGGEAGNGGDASELLAAIKRREKEQQGRKGLKAGKKQRTDK